MPLSGRFSRSRGFALLFVLVALLAGCSSSSDAGGNFRLSAGQLTPPTTQPAPDFTTTTAEAKGPALEVFADKPAAEGPTVAPAAYTARAVQPIPRQGLAYEFAQVTPTGWMFKNPTYFGNPLVMVVTSVEGEWLKVTIPARPNGQQGWVRATDVNLAQHRFHAELVLSERLFTVWDDVTPVAQTNVVVGTDSTPTPLGTTYIAEKIPAATAGVSPGGAYGPWILSTASYSETLEQFDGGLPVIAFHGTNNPQLIGSAASNGCVRMPNDVVTLLAETIPAGTPVTVRE
jgi:lipoprotein-anchoring transpeptidase ErfK/SrfK